MFKKKDSDTLKVSGKISKTQANNLALLVARMQKNADQVEKDVLKAEELLAIDAENEKKELDFQHQKEVSIKLGEAEALLQSLFLDVDKAKKYKHPQGSEIESDVSHLHERWLKDCTFYRDVYEPVNDVELMPRIDWAPVLNQKQREVNSEEYGPTMTDLKKQIASHNILHREIEAYSSQLSANSTSTKEEFVAIKKQYTNLLDNSKWRSHYLNSLYDYMQGCTRELAYLEEEQDKIMKQDWSDRMIDPPDVRRQYENFKNNSLLAHETEVNRLQDDGDRLVELKHPASATIQAQRDDLRNEWQKFLNLCICQETHLDNVEDFKKYQLDTETLSESLTKLNATLDPKTVSKNSNSQILLQLEAEERSVQRAELLLADLRKRSTTIAPLKLRRAAPSKTVTVESLCDWNTDKAETARGDRFTLKTNTDKNWEVATTSGATKNLPGVCFLIPPPDTDAINQVDLLGGELADIKKKRASLQASLKNQNTELSRPQQAVQVSSAPPNPKAVALDSKLDKLDGDLAQAEQDILSRLRAPLDRNDPAADMANRLKEQEKSSAALKALEQQKMAAQAEMEPLLSKESAGSTSSALPLKLNAAKNKQDGIAALNDLYTKKAKASLNLMGQIKKVDGVVSDLEKNLSADGAIPDAPDAIQARTLEVQSLRKKAAGSQDEMKKLGQDLEATEQLCSSLQQGYQEYCPDIRQQGAQVKQLQNRYANVNNQLKERENLLQEAATKNQEFQSANKSLSSFLNSLPNNKISPSDDLSQINSKQSSEERVMEDLTRKGDDVHRVVDLSQDLQDVLNEYEVNAGKYNSTLADKSTKNAEKLPSPTLAESVQKQEKALVNCYAETAAERKQRLNQMALAKNMIVQNEETVQQVAQQQVHLERQQKSVEEIDTLNKELAEELDRCTHAENDLKTFKSRMVSLKSRRGVERIEEKEVLQYYRDPKLEAELLDMQNEIHKEALKRSSTQGEVEVINKKILTQGDSLKNAVPRLVTREVTEFERDPQLDVEAAKLKDEISKMKDEDNVVREETIQMKTEVTVLQAKRPTIKERIVRKEVVKVEKDPEMVKAVQTFSVEISEEDKKIKTINDEIFQTRSQINALERIIPTIEPKVVTREIKKIEQDPELIKESKKVRTEIEEEKVQNSSLANELKSLQSRYAEVQNLKPKVEVKEIVNEIYRIDPTTEAEITRLKKKLLDASKLRSNLEKEITVVTTDRNTLRSQKPKVELKQVLKEVVKEERSPENIREIQRLNDQLNTLHHTYNTVLDELSLARKERDQWKAEKSKVETKLVAREVIKYEDDPLLEKEADRLRKEVREETQLRRTTEEMVFDLQNKYLLLERQKPEEKVVVQEVMRLQKDPRQRVEHDKLGTTLDEAVKSRRKVELEVQQLKTLLEEKERLLRESDERQKKIQVESELKAIKVRINELENAPPPVEESIVIEEVLKVERDPKLERMTNGLRSDMDKETNDILRYQRDIRNLNVRLELLQREKAGERTVYKEVVRVEKDQAVEAERDRLRDQVNQEKYARKDLEEQIRRLSDKLNILQSTKSSSSREETTLVLQRDALQREKDDISRELKKLESERQDVSISFQQQTKMMSERSQVNRQKSLKMESDMHRLEREILDEKDQIHSRNITIKELQTVLDKEDKADTRTRETNVSTKITILDPETGKDMSPYDAYLQGLIDRTQYIHLQELECDWEEITSKGRDGETSVLQDRKSGKQYSIKNALRDGKLTQSDLQKYKDGKMPISEFALLVAGEKEKQPQFNSITPKATSALNSASPKKPSAAQEIYPIAGIMDTNTSTCYTIRSAAMRRLIDSTTAQRLLEAQAATGGIIDITNNERFSVHKASERGLIESSQLQRLLNAQKAFTGIEDPITRECLSVGEAVQKGWMPKETAMRYMEAQHLTGGLVVPNTGRVDIVEAIGAKMIDSSMMRELQADTNYAKEIVDPLTHEKISYKQAMARCKTDPQSGLSMLPASSKESGYPSYTPHRYSYGN
ncbi:envoplakin a [Osmerus mordax]|uniref:envoplakin a n=1 Tax=Osmerus mordax TaxID=8014 RepID=UPI00350F5ABE